MTNVRQWALGAAAAVALTAGTLLGTGAVSFAQTSTTPTPAATGARTYLHTHLVPQVLHCTDGRGILATRAQQNLVEPGDVVYVPAGEEHWHGATPDSHFVHLSVRPPGETTWTKIDPLS